MNPAQAMRRAARVGWRLGRLCIHLAWGMAQAGWLRWRLGPRWYLQPRGEARRHGWLQALAAILGLRVRVSGEPMSVPGLLVANHVSWLDVVAVAAANSTTFVAKDDVRAWPVIGWLGRWGGTVFLRRAKRAALSAAIDTLVEVIEHGQRVTLFPEGTTGDGRGVGRFHRGLLQAAVNTGTPVQAIAVRYRRGGDIDTLAPFIGEDTFVPHLLRVVAEPDTEVLLDFQAPIVAPTRRALAERCEAAIRRIVVGPPECGTERAAPAAQGVRRNRTKLMSSDLLG